MKKVLILLATICATLVVGVPVAGSMAGDPGSGTCYYIWSWSPTAGWFVSGIHCY